MQVLFMESDEASVFVLFFGLAFIFGGYLWLLSILVPWIYHHYKKQYPRGFLKHVLYYCGFQSLEKYPSYYEDEFFE